MRDAATADLIKAFDTDLADTVRSLVYTEVSRADAAYDPSTGTAAPGEASFSSRGILYDQSTTEVLNSNIEIAATKLLIIQAEYKGSRNPKIGDRVVIEGVQYRVDGKAPDPASITWELTLQAE